MPRLIVLLFLTAVLLALAPAGASAVHEEAAVPDEIETGALGRFKYFSDVELNQLGFPERDLSEVKYLAELDLELLASGGPPPDAIPSIDEPRFTAPGEADEWLADGQLVLGIRFEGVARAYPLAILNWHEIVNDTVAGTEIVVTYCPLCDSGLAFLAPELEDRRVEFGTSGRLFRSDLVMYDRATATFWEQFQGRPIVGPLVGEAGWLHRIPVDIVPYGLWKAEHPDTQVLARPRAGERLGNRTDQRSANDEGFVRDYAADPYSSYRVRNPGAGGTTAFGVPFNDDRLRAKDAVVGIAVNGRAKAYAREALLERRLLNDELGGVPLLVVVSPAEEILVFERALPDGAVLTFSLSDGRLTDDRGNRWGFDGQAVSGPLTGTRLTRVAATPSFWFAWVSFNPDTGLYGGSNEP